MEWPLADVREGSIDIAEESFGETGSFVLVPPRGILEIGLGEWSNDEPVVVSRNVTRFMTRAAFHCDFPRLSTAFQQWLAAQVPGETDADLGYAFVRAADGAHVSRELDTRGLTAPNQTLFERAAREAKPIPGPYAPDDDVDRGLQWFKSSSASILSVETFALEKRQKRIWCSPTVVSLLSSLDSTTAPAAR